MVIRKVVLGVLSLLSRIEMKDNLVQKSGSLQTELLTAQMNKQLKLYDAEAAVYKPLFALEKGEGAVKGVHKTEKYCFYILDMVALWLF